MNLNSLSVCLAPIATPLPSFVHGLREQLALSMLLLYCEHTLIASTLSKASRASQHGV